MKRPNNQIVCILSLVLQWNLILSIYIPIARGDLLVDNGYDQNDMSNYIVTGLNTVYGYFSGMQSFTISDPAWRIDTIGVVACASLNSQMIGILYRDVNGLPDKLNPFFTLTYTPPLWYDWTYADLSQDIVLTQGRYWMCFRPATDDATHGICKGTQGENWIGIRESDGTQFIREPAAFRITGQSISEPVFVSLSIEAEPANISINTVTPSIGVHDYDAGQTVNLAASPYIQCPAVYQFDHWTGDVTNPDSANTTVRMNGNKTVTAVFTLADPVCGDLCHPNFTMGDLNHDCIVDLGDFAVLATRWMNCTKPECDEVAPPADTDPPLPNPAQWIIEPYQTGPDAIHMTSVTAVDIEDNGVEYYFECQEDNRCSSGWITDSTYTISGLTLGQTYTFRVKYRDRSFSLNETQYSSAVPVTITEIDITPPTPNPGILAAFRINIGSQGYHVLTAGMATDPSGVEYQFECIDSPTLISSAVTVDWINAGNVISGIHVFNQTWYPNGGTKAPNKLYVPVTGTAPHTYRVRTRDQSPAQNTSQWSQPVTVQ